MDFFEHQELARRTSTRLVVLFVLAVIGVVIAVNVVASFIYLGFVENASYFVGRRGLPTGFYATNTLVTLALIGGGTWWEMQRLRSGGDAVAAMVGARPVDPSTGDLLERRLVNIVEEMALASGVAVPKVYLMDNEPSINAFAAGHSVNDAVIAVTRGALTRLTRDELQGVIGHEFSHILNGDMRLNLRLIGVLFGLLMIAMFGRFLMEMSRGSRSSRGGAGGLVVAGLALWIVGYVGVFFGRLIKSAVSRQREYLADASAVQFTRNPDGIGSALRKIGGLTQETGLGTKIEHPNAETLSHLFLGAARRNFASGLFATHPPLADRIKRIYGRALDFLPAPEQPLALAMGGLAPMEAPAAASPIEFTPAGATAAPRAIDTTASPIAALVGGAQAAVERVPVTIGTVASGATEAAQRAAAHPAAALLDAARLDTTSAQLLVLGMLVDKDRDLGAQQRQQIVEALGSVALTQVDRFHEAVQQLPPGARLPLLDRVMPTLRKLPQDAAARLLRLAHGLIVADGRITLAEFLLFTVLKRRLGPDAHRAVPVKYANVAQLAPEAALVLSLVATVRLPETPERAFNAGVLLLPGVDATLVPAEKIALDAVSRALDRLNQLAPLAKPAFIKACTATAFIDGATHWKAASCLRTICAALDAPLPPQVAAE
ncbi:MAG: Zn-dependent protease [Betaproteobacteria bacterium]|nr:MAG: Zn-dependent protease [Betaproteobacteria bacterium]